MTDLFGGKREGNRLSRKFSDSSRKIRRKSTLRYQCYSRQYSYFKISPKLAIKKWKKQKICEINMWQILAEDAFGNTNRAFVEVIFGEFSSLLMRKFWQSTTLY